MSTSLDGTDVPSARGWAAHQSAQLLCFWVLEWQHMAWQFRASAAVPGCGEVLHPPAHLLALVGIPLLAAPCCFLCPHGKYLCFASCTLSISFLHSPDGSDAFTGRCLLCPFTSIGFVLDLTVTQQRTESCDAVQTGTLCSPSPRMLQCMPVRQGDTDGAIWAGVRSGQSHCCVWIFLGWQLPWPAFVQAVACRQSLPLSPEKATQAWLPCSGCEAAGQHLPPPQLEPALPFASRHPCSTSLYPWAG